MKMHLIFENEEEIAKGMALYQDLEGIRIHYPEEAPKEPEATKAKRPAKPKPEPEPDAEAVHNMLKAFSKDFGRDNALKILHKYGTNFNAVTTDQYDLLVKDLEDERQAREQKPK